MKERGHDRDALHCRVKVKELRNACEAYRCSGAAPATCRFYKELDAILGADPTSTPCTTMDTSEPSSKRQEEEEESRSEGAQAEEDTPESLDACSQELFSSQEEGSQSWRPVLREGQTPEEVPGRRGGREVPVELMNFAHPQKRHFDSFFRNNFASLFPPPPFLFANPSSVHHVSTQTAQPQQKQGLYQPAAPAAAFCLQQDLMLIHIKPSELRNLARSSPPPAAKFIFNQQPPQFGYGCEEETSFNPTHPFLLSYRLPFS
ncbi:hypothetical protein UY3_11206 [Chelonia mydas]|uniref:Uncharacterized protein n=1 Tax=Chelonia mydas TaxID=8469 RepID=M7B3J9_CHEMY|nr:hypothetical protein UY3_11206 [Chelonia mydas]